MLFRLAGSDGIPGDGTLEALRALSPSAAARLLDEASEAGLAGLVARRLSSPDAGPLLPALDGWVRARRRTSFAAGLVLESVLLRVVEALRRRSIPVLAFKGVVLSRLLHGESGIRDSEDIDLLVAPGDLERAEGVLGDLGFRRGIEIPARALGHFRSVGHQLPWTDGSGAVVDLHWSLAPPYDSFPLEEDGVRARAVEAEVAGTGVPTLSDEDLLLYLCYHGCKSLWGRLGWVADVARLLAVRPGIRGEEVLRAADATGSRRMLAVGLLLAREIPGARLPPLLAAAAEEDRVAADLAAAFREALLGRAPLPAGRGGQGLLHIRMRRGSARRARYLRAVSFTPRPRDWHRWGASRFLRTLAGCARTAGTAAFVGFAALGSTARFAHAEGRTGAL